MTTLRFALLGALAALVAPGSPAVAHSGGLDGCGCHAGSRPYHCHRNPCNHCPGSFDCKGKIRVVTVPRARVTIDDVDMGLSPTRPLRAQHGSVNVVLDHKILGSKTLKASVEYGTTTTHTIRW